MDQSAALKNIQQFIENAIVQWPAVFLVDLTLSPANKITVLLDADNGMDIARCAEVNRALYKHVEQNNLFGESNFSIEVSSPGTDRPLTSLRQYQKNTGRNIEVKMNDGSLLEGRLKAADESGIIIEETPASKKKNLTTKTIEIPFTEIRQVRVLVTI